MKYCVEYNSKFKYLKEIDELTIIFNRKDSSLPSFIEKYQDKRINIYIKEITDFIEHNCLSLIKELFNKYHNIYLKLPNYNVKESQELYKQLQNTTIPYFFDTFIRSWDDLYGYILLNPSDLYIVEELGFNIKDIYDIISPKSINLRIFPNIAQSTWKNTPALKKFFIRPDDIIYYEPYVSTIEFIGTYNKNNIYYKVYAKDKKWFGKLNELIIDFNNDTLDNKFLLFSFGEKRVNCNKKCLKGKSCHICESYENLATALKDKNYIIKKKSIIDKN